MTWWLFRFLLVFWSVWYHLGHRLWEGFIFLLTWQGFLSLCWFFFMYPNGSLQQWVFSLIACGLSCEDISSSSLSSSPCVCLIPCCRLPVLCILQISSIFLISGPSLSILILLSLTSMLCYSVNFSQEAQHSCLKSKLVVANWKTLMWVILESNDKQFIHNLFLLHRLHCCWS